MQALLNTIRHFIPLTEADTALIQQLFKIKQLSKGEYFVQEGYTCKQAGFIQQGLVRYFLNKEGQELTYEFGKEGEFVCNYASFLDQSVSDESIQVLEDTSLLVISFDDLQTFYKQVPAGDRFGRLVVESIFVRAKKQLTSLYSEPPEVRYRRFLQLYPDLQQRIPQYYISSYVGVKPPSLSRIRKRLAQS
ncbi:MAG TPA: Crp/Fnr family transcriptional regulator [Chitinophaga sp.]|uniref:Crp/Fnr family transcriptional regulator n=1 Tax=Chitinophaga sp. TaxID=1869181 RepID=UPI002F923CF3